MSPSFANQFRRDLEIAAARVDREHITHWLMMFSAQKPLELSHPRIGEIRFEGITFYGSVVDVYDRYVLFVIDDLIAEATQQAESALPGIPRQDRAAAVAEATSAISAAKARLLARAREIKGTAMGRGGSAAPRPRIAEQINWTPFAERLAYALRSIRLSDMVKHKVSQNWFKRYRTALGRMRSASPNEFAMRAGRLARVLREPEIEDVRAMLTEDLKLQPFLDLARSDEIEFGAPFPFPDDPAHEMGVAILLLDALAADNELAESLASNHYDVPGDYRIVASWINLVDQVYAPLADALYDYLEGQGWLSSPTAPVDSGNSIRVSSSSGVVIQQGVSHSHQTATISVNNAEVMAALNEFRKLVRPLVEEASLQDFDADIRTLEAQLTKPKPSIAILREAGSTLRSLCEGVTAGAMTAPAVAAATHLWQALGL